MGILKELKEQMEGDLSEEQRAEMAGATAFAELRASKSKEIEATERQSEQKEDQLAQADMDLAEAKGDLERTEAAFSEDQKFMINLKQTCKDADKNFDLRKNARLEEIKTVSDAITILTSDKARDAMSGTFTFIQLSSRVRQVNGRQRRVAALLRGVAAKTKNPEMSILATSVELDSFTRVKKAIDDMIRILKLQDADEVKKHDWCNSELHENEVATTKTQDIKLDLATTVESLGSKLGQLTDEVAQAHAHISELQVALQSATENRQKESMNFQKTVADQRATQSVLKTALERLAKYYDQENFVQTVSHSQGARQTPPQQVEYKPNSGATSIMSLLEKLIHEARDLENDARQGEQEAQQQYETLIADTNASVEGLQRTVVAKLGEKAATEKEKMATEMDLTGAGTSLENLAKTDTDLHGECDYLLRNFGVRQGARQQEIEALQQANQILSGATLS